MGNPRIPASVWLALATRNSPAPILYQTRTLATGLVRHSQQKQQKHYSTSKPPKSFLQRKAAAVSSSSSSASASASRRPSPATEVDPIPSPQRKPLTMTNDEKEIFGNLLEQLGAERRAPTGVAGAAATVAPGSGSGGEEQPALRDEEYEEISQISSIFESVLQDMREKKRDTPMGAGGRHPGREDEEWTPERAMIEEELQSNDFSDDWVTEMMAADKLSVDRAIEAVIARESAKIEDALWEGIKDGDDDITIWTVCKKRIFGILRYIDRKKHGMLEMEPAVDWGDSRHRLTIPKSVPVEAVIAELYPSMLLRAFRLMTLHYPQSLLIRQFRVTIRSMGRESALLGGSTELYNEMIYFHWRGCYDLPGVVTLLKEMEVTGVEPNRRTCGLLRSIAGQRDQDLKEQWKQVKLQNKAHSTMDPWWNLAPNRKAVRQLFRVGGWLDRLQDRLRDINRAAPQGKPGQ
ncbi:hypothetical protein BO71DRAFT_396290 [Aspergillus ellipticus CBS 707.79]|uniref:Mtf2-like C-terminal domain-containing protein n=1 Tax=Aspergillus ellipticus CBS 707.79 TaxID=1448320 RepID=A0A319DT95_9EURO|nr:hypothetical protein BO71DRAFT_396290 [Aspergillus ellipticus CBS 707.79]